MASVTRLALTSARAGHESARSASTRYHRMMPADRWWPQPHEKGGDPPARVRTPGGVRVRLHLNAEGWKTQPDQVITAGRAVTIGHTTDSLRTVPTAICTDGHAEPNDVLPCPHVLKRTLTRRRSDGKTRAAGSSSAFADGLRLDCALDIRSVGCPRSMDTPVS